MKYLLITFSIACVALISSYAPPSSAWGHPVGPACGNDFCDAEWSCKSIHATYAQLLHDENGFNTAVIASGNIYVDMFCDYNHPTGWLLD